MRVSTRTWRSTWGHRQSRASPRWSTRTSTRRRPGRPAFRRRRVRPAACGATDPRPRFDAPRGLLAANETALLVATSGSLSAGGCAVTRVAGYRTRWIDHQAKKGVRREPARTAVTCPTRGAKGSISHRLRAKAGGSELGSDAPDFTHLGRLSRSSRGHMSSSARCLSDVSSNDRCTWLVRRCTAGRSRDARRSR